MSAVWAVFRGGVVVVVSASLAAALAGCGGGGRAAEDGAVIAARKVSVDRFLADFDRGERECIERVMPKNRLKEVLVAALDPTATDKELPEAIFEITSCAERPKIAVTLARTMIAVFPEKPLAPGLAKMKLPATKEGMEEMFRRFPSEAGSRPRAGGLEMRGPARFSAVYRHRGSMERTHEVIAEDLKAGPGGQGAESGPTGEEAVGWRALDAGKNLRGAGRDGDVVWARCALDANGETRQAAYWGTTGGDWLFSAQADSEESLGDLIVAFGIALGGPPSAGQPSTRPR